MTVQQLIEDLKTAPLDSEVCWQMNGIYPASGIEIGRMKDAKVGYVMLVTGGIDGIKAFQHRPPRIIEGEQE